MMSSLNPSFNRFSLSIATRPRRRGFLLAVATAGLLGGCSLLGLGDPEQEPDGALPDSGPGSVTVKSKVVDHLDVGLRGLKVTFTPAAGSKTAPVSTNTANDGSFSVALESGTFALEIFILSVSIHTATVVVKSDGTHDAGSVIKVKLPDNRVDFKSPFVGKLPPLYVNPPAPTGGQQATARVDVPGASSITLTTTGNGCGALGGSTSSGATLSKTAVVGTSGSCTLVATVQKGTASETLKTSFTVSPSKIDLPGFHVTDAVYVSAPLNKDGSAVDPPVLGTITGPGTLINGGSAKVQLSLSGATKLKDIRNVRVAKEGGKGYFILPASVDGGVLTIQLRVDRDFFTKSSGGGGPPTLALLFQIEDIYGRLSKAIKQIFSMVKVGSGDIQVSLSWDTATDVDLHLVDPSNEEIYYKNKTAASGGVLDLDSNAECTIDNINNENITWAKGSAPKGKFIVRVDYYEACGNKDANYTVTVTVCGETSTYTGSFKASQADTGGKGSGVKVADFEYKGCPYRAAGRATYDDRVQTTTGLAASVMKLPIRFARVEVRRSSDDKALAVGDTNNDGMFDIEFTNDGKAGYYVRVEAQQDSKYAKQKVINSKGAVYYQDSSGKIDETVTPLKTDILVRAPESGAGPAFNIFDMGVIGSTKVRLREGTTPSLLTWIWTSGEQGVCKKATSCYMGAGSKSVSGPLVSVLSLAADPDEYDDLVLLHEYGHFYLDKFSSSNTPGGGHSVMERSDPRLAWNEGGATFFGNLAKGTSMYLDTNSKGIYIRWDLETLTEGADKNPVPSGTSDKTQSGDISEGRVSGILWDLADADNENNDTLSTAAAVFDAISALGSSSTTDRGVAGVDLVDFLDAWFCLGHGNKGDKSSGVEGIATTLHGFPYDFAQVKSCK